MNPKRGTVVIVSGAPATGKTTLAREIGARLGIPVFTKDELKEAIADELGRPADVAESQRLGLAAYRVLYAIGASLAAAGATVVIESNFRRGRSESELLRTVGAADARLIHCTADPATVLGRYGARFRRGERHAVHLDADRVDDVAVDIAAGRFEPLDLDVPCLVVHTDDGYRPGLDEILAFASSRAEPGRSVAGVAAR